MDNYSDATYHGRRDNSPIEAPPTHTQTPIKKPRAAKPAFLEFFAGSGLVAYALQSYFKAVWANDICKKKAAVYTANHGQQHFLRGSISNVNGRDLPDAKLSWASFPCQDLSLAGLTAVQFGISGTPLILS
ncbi:MAG: DNA cytosine methyltransferase [Gallionellaceae bacterium]